MKKSSLNKLIAIYDAIGYLTSEIGDPFDQCYKGGTDKLLSDFTSVLEDCGVRFAECVKGQYYVMSYKTSSDKPEKKWGICTDKTAPDASWVLTGFSSSDEARETLLNPEVFDDYNGRPIEVIDAA